MQQSSTIRLETQQSQHNQVRERRPRAPGQRGLGSAAWVGVGRPGLAVELASPFRLLLLLSHSFFLSTSSEYE